MVKITQTSPALTSRRSFHERHCYFILQLKCQFVTFTYTSCIKHDNQMFFSIFSECFHFFFFLSLSSCWSFTSLVVGQSHFQLCCLVRVLKRHRNTVWFVLKQLRPDDVWHVSDQCHCSSHSQTPSHSHSTYNTSNLKLMKWRSQACRQLHWAFRSVNPILTILYYTILHYTILVFLQRGMGRSTLLSELSVQYEATPNS